MQQHVLQPAAYLERELRCIVCWLLIVSAEFGEKLEEEISQGLEMATAKGSVESLLDLLPSEFDKSDLIALRVKRKQSTTKQSIGTILLRWKKAGKIEQVDGLAKYRQLKKN